MPKTYRHQVCEKRRKDARVDDWRQALYAAIDKDLRFYDWSRGRCRQVEVVQLVRAGPRTSIVRTWNLLTHDPDRPMRVCNKLLWPYQRQPEEHYN